MVMAQAAAVTERVLLGPSVLILPFYHPLSLAKQLATLDHMSKGRIYLAVGVGERPKIHEIYGIPMHERGERTNDYIEIMKSGHKFVNKLQNKRFYILSKSKEEFIGKKCPKNRSEQVRDVRYTGKPRNFDNNLSKIAKSLGVEIYYVEIENSPEIQNLAVKMLPKLDNFGLHVPDNFFLSFAALTKSSMITSDQDLIRCCKQQQLPFVDFHDFAEKVMQGSPIAVVLRERRKLRKKQQSRWNQ